MRSQPILVSFLLSLAAGASACSRTPSEPPPGPAAAASSAPAAPATAPAGSALPAGNLALAWDDPPRWKRRPPSSGMRAAEYQVPRAAGDADDGECTVITFGPGQGGGVDENIDRWVGQMDSHGAPPARTTRTTHGMKVTRVDVSGTYSGMRMPGAPAAAPHPGWRLVGAIVEAPSGAWFFKLTGPAATVQAAAAELDALVDSAHPRS